MFLSNIYFLVQHHGKPLKRHTYQQFDEFEKQPRKGVFLAVNVPGGREPEFAKVCDSGFIFGTIAPTLWPSFRKNKPKTKWSPDMHNQDKEI